MTRPPWEYDGRHYAVTAFSDVSTRDGYGWELEEAGRGQVAEVFLDDTTGAFTIRVFTDEPLPFDLVHRFVTEAGTDIRR
ncbi:hypothetical protein [Actinokineospora diospyrosa]|uniref:YD repeat-containing protein n=1 Tax=Actinokineospora diospyrosa TaxID=103728 RepID=A0ABT1I8N0_9PSEU|nr:hypothetical protein [Actinokineospora diospyrosa]MCP2268990.1 hypothetical protein [Actinokineospora diospyrosa]